MNIIDLFAGAGGFSLGFEMEGFNSVLAIEKDEMKKVKSNLTHSSMIMEL